MIIVINNLPKSALFVWAFLVLLLPGCNNKPEIRPKNPALALYSYPNPAVEYTNIEIENPRAESFTLYIFDTAGKKIVEQSSNQSRYTYRFSLNGRPEGTYQMVVKSATTLAQQKFVKI